MPVNTASHYTTNSPDATIYLVPLKSIKSNWKITASFLRDGVYAANDGIITTFAVIAGAQGAGLSSNLVLLFGFANLFADALSMAAGNYLGMKSEKEYNGGKLISRFVRSAFKSKDKPIYHSYITFTSFIIAGLIPLTPFVFGLAESFTASIILLVVGMISLGYLRSIFVKTHKLHMIIETLVIGVATAIIAYSVGFAADRFFIQD